MNRVARKDWDDQASVSDAVSKLTNTVGESLTVQSQAEDADINVIMRKYGLTGRMPENPRIPSYGDFSEVTDYRSALDAIHAADVAFMEIPAEKRALFANDPQRLLEFAYDANNASAMKEIFGERVQVSTGADRASAGSAVGGSQGVSGAATSGSGDGGKASAGGAAASGA